MKRSLIAILFLLSLQKTVAQTSNDLAGEDLKGNVKMVTETQYYTGTKGASTKTIDKYDAKGYLTEEIHYDYDLKLNTRKSLKYDTGKDGSVTRLKEYNDSGAMVRTVDYKSDSLHRVVAEDDNRKTGDELIFHKKEYYYDSIGNETREKNYTNGALAYSTEYIYDKKGRMTGTKSYDKDKKIIMQYDYYYIKYKQWEHCEKVSDGVRTHFFKTLDTAGVVRELTTYTGDYSKETIESYGNFDKWGNWLKLVVTGTAVEHYFIKREIEYYK